MVQSDERPKEGRNVTATAHEPISQADVLLEGFLALDTPEGFRAELIEGEIVVTPPPDGDHEDYIGLIVTQVIRRSRPPAILREQGTSPDSAAPDHALPGPGRPGLRPRGDRLASRGAPRPGDPGRAGRTRRGGSLHRAVAFVAFLELIKGEAGPIRRAPRVDHRVRQSGDRGGGRARSSSTRP
ncbi:hypothetical protein SALBM217S_09567 [Streptomyces griseoloalbus]